MLRYTYAIYKRFKDELNLKAIPLSEHHPRSLVPSAMFMLALDPFIKEFFFLYPCARERASELSSTDELLMEFNRAIRG